MKKNTINIKHIVGFVQDYEAFQKEEMGNGKVQFFRQ